ncbi:MAG: hypothetical protein IPO81_30460 [Kouleothrix sp.]|nr:hypothetical protein [Kouleothrix sp.]
MSLPQETQLLLIVVLLVIILTLLHHARAVAEKRPISRRPMPGLDVIGLALGRGAETGRAIHLSPGSGAIGARSSTVETVAGLLAAERVATSAALNGAPLLASSGDAVTHLALRGALRQSYQSAGLGQDYDPTNVQLLAHQDPMAYASGVTTLYERQKLEASQLIGSFGQEFLLASEDGAQHGVPQVGGATTATALPLIYLSTEGALIGEEIYAAEAYLARSPAPLARLLTQDALRTVIIVAIVVLLLLSAAGFQIAL